MHSQLRAASPLARALALLAAVLSGALAAVVLLVADGPLADIPVAYAFPAVGGLYAGLGLFAWWRQPVNRTGALLVWAGVTRLTASLANSAVPALIAVGTGHRRGSGVHRAAPTSCEPWGTLARARVDPHGRCRVRRRHRVAGAAVAFQPQPPPYDVLLVAP